MIECRRSGRRSSDASRRPWRCDWGESRTALTSGQRRALWPFPVGEDPPDGEPGAELITDQRWTHRGVNNMTPKVRGSGWSLERLQDIMIPWRQQATIPASRLHGHHDRPSMVSVGHHHLALERADVLRGPVRVVLHDPRGQPRAVGAEDRAARTCRSRRPTPRSWCCPR